VSRFPSAIKFKVSRVPVKRVFVFFRYQFVGVRTVSDIAEYPHMIGFVPVGFSMTILTLFNVFVVPIPEYFFQRFKV
jgi:hypothetical protein